MTNSEKSILLLSRSPSVVDSVTRVVSTIPNSALRAHRANVLEMNGHASRAAAGSGIVIVETNELQDEELGAIRSMVEAAGEGSLFIALTDSNLPFARARLLKNVGVDEILPLPVAEDELADILSGSAGKSSGAPDRGSGDSRQGSVIVVTRARGGIGATTIATNLAYLLQDRRGMLRKKARRRVAIVDLDLQFGDVGIFLDVEDGGAMMEIAKGLHVPDRNFIRGALIESKCGVSVLPAPSQPIPVDALDSGKVAGILDALRAEYDYVVVDMPQALVPWIAPVLARADKILMATDTTVPGVRHARRLINFYTEDSPVLPIEIVVTHEKRPMFLSGHHKEASKVLERGLAHWLAHDEKSATSAMDRGEPVAQMHRSSELSKTLRKMTQAVSASLSKRPASSVTQN